MVVDGSWVGGDGEERVSEASGDNRVPWDEGFDRGLYACIVFETKEMLGVGHCRRWE